MSPVLLYSIFNGVIKILATDVNVMCALLVVLSCVYVLCLCCVCVLGWSPCCTYTVCMLGWSSCCTYDREDEEEVSVAEKLLMQTQDIKLKLHREENRQIV